MVVTTNKPMKFLTHFNTFILAFIVFGALGILTISGSAFYQYGYTNQYQFQSGDCNGRQSQHAYQRQVGNDWVQFDANINIDYQYQYGPANCYQGQTTYQETASDNQNQNQGQLNEQQGSGFQAGWQWQVQSSTPVQDTQYQNQSQNQYAGWNNVFQVQLQDQNQTQY